ncbi:MAG: type II toxin-antitoxin system VapC family toxin [Candidatus Solibacter usitatus]|nr:type II toxin-antitoxin system VapC family toxin [Candidatus Solibacter usitatus]
MIVIDASAVLEVLLNTPAGGRIEKRILAPGESLHAPHLLDLEVAQVLRRYGLSGELSPVRAREALQDFQDLPIARYPHDLLLGRVWELRHNFTAYDAAYLALAEVLGATLVTRDAAFRESRGHHAAVELT